ncbi:tRNA(fMet)-specific endonuclease VapC [Paraconexibacter sp. AEG42_29]|uniref:Ribonuclease VapC n=1 Tax=Paraconexibacter sp. AEG42_29 TaxID=2997339 RepID=A0AAU7APL0_9ACTN
MTLVVDTSFVLSLAIVRDEFHVAARDFLRDSDEDLVTSPLAVAEMDHLITQRGGPAARDVLWADFESGAYGVRWWADAMSETLTIARDAPKVGLADASLVALARRLRTGRILSFDSHFASFDLTLLPERP